MSRRQSHGRLLPSELFGLRVPAFRCCLSLADNVVGDIAVNIRQAEVTSGVAVG